MINQFSSPILLSADRFVGVGGGNKLPIIGTGNVCIQIIVEGTQRTCMLVCACVLREARDAAQAGTLGDRRSRARMGIYTSEITDDVGKPCAKRMEKSGS